jgi:nitronate monooxygenase
MVSMALTDLLGIRYPIIQAPMVGVSTPELAAAVSNAGALGSIGIGACQLDQARHMIRETRALTEAPFNVNLFCHQPAVADPEREAAWLDYLSPFFAEFGSRPPDTLSAPYQSFIEQPEMLALLLEMTPTVVSFHFGLPPADWITRLHERGIKTLGCATSSEEAGQAEDAGCDAIIAQGVEAGGHRGTFSPERGDAGIDTLSLVRSLSTSSKRPVIAAGGIMTGDDIHRALQEGAAAAQLGTAFVLCPESAANAAYRATLSSEQSRQTGITAVISGRPARGIVNRMHHEVDRPRAPALPDYPIAYQAGKALAAAAAENTDGFSARWAGTGAPRARELPAAQLVRTLATELQRHS